MAQTGLGNFVIEEWGFSSFLVSYISPSLVQLEIQCNPTEIHSIFIE